MPAVPKPAPRPSKAKKPLQKVNRKRRSREWIRAYGSQERVKFVQSLPCCVPNCFPMPRHDGPENHHIETGGARRKADADKIVPLCSTHHIALHAYGRETFEKHYRIDLTPIAAETEARWLSYLNPKKESA